MAIVAKLLWTGIVGASATDSAAVPTAKAWLVKTISMVNVDTVNRSFDVSLHISGTDWRLTPVGASLPASAQFLYQTPLSIGAGGKLRFAASAADALEVVVCGFERDV